MADNRKLSIIVELQDKASKQLSGLSGAIEKNQAAFAKAGAVGAVAFATLSAGITKSVMEFAKFEQAEVAFTSMLGSAEAAKDMIKQLAEFSAETPFQFEDIVQATRTLVSFGASGDEAVDKIRFLGDIAAGAQVPLADLAQIFGKVQTKGKAMTEEILQMAERGIPIIDALAEQFGVGKEAIFEMAEQGKLTADVVEDALRGMTKEGEIFAGQMDKQSQTIFGLFSTLRDNISLLMADVGVLFSEDVVKFTKKITEFTARIREWIQDNPKLAATIIVVTTALAGLVTVIGILGLALPAIITGFTLLVSPISLVVIGVGALIALFVVFKDKIMQVFELIESQTGLMTAFKFFWDTLVVLFREHVLVLFNQLKDLFILLEPLIKVLALGVGVILLGALVALSATLGTTITLFTGWLEIGGKVADFFKGAFKTAIDTATDTVSKLHKQLQNVIEAMAETGVIKSIGNKIGGLFSGKSKSVNDAIISPDGDIITTHPDDYLIATKNPKSLGGGGVTVNVTGGTFYGIDDLANRVGNAIVGNLGNNMKFS